MNAKRILILGGSGFIGTALAEKLTEHGAAITIPTRRVARAQHLRLLPGCDIVHADIHDAATRAALIARHDAVVNLVGILHGNFAAAHVALPTAVARACVDAGVEQLIHMSALGAAADAPSAYLRSRAAGEAAVSDIARAHPQLHLTVLRPSVVFGKRDRFINLFADLSHFPLIPLGSPEAQFQPVWVGDVVRAISTCLAAPAVADGTFPLVGPTIYRLRELVEFAAATRQKRPWIVGLGRSLTWLQAGVFQCLPGKLITLDNVRSMQVPNTSPTPFPAQFGAPHALEAVFASHDAEAALNRYRQSAGRTQVK